MHNVAASAKSERRPSEIGAPAEVKSVVRRGDLSRLGEGVVRATA